MSTAKSIRWLHETVKDEETAIKFLREKGLLHSERLCPSCGRPMRLGRGGMSWRCYKRSCRKELSVRRGTWFEDRRQGLKFRKAVEIIFFWSRRYTSMKFCKDELGLSNKTAGLWNRYLRHVAAGALAGTHMQLGWQTRKQTAESLWAQARRICRRQRGTRQNALPLHICEFIWRKRLRASDDAFDAILSDILRLHPPRVDILPVPVSPLQ